MTFLHPGPLLLLGTDTPDGARILAKLHGFPGALWHGTGDMPRGADLAIVAGAPDDVPGQLRAVAASGCKVAVVCGQVAGLGGAERGWVQLGALPGVAE